MKSKSFFSIYFFKFILHLSKCHDFEELTIHMPNVRPNRSDQYLCFPVKVDNDNTYFIVGYEPHILPGVHHINLLGSIKPANVKSVWDCSFRSSDVNIQFIAASESKYQLPDGLGFKIGKNSNIKYLVLQVHYGNIDSFKYGHTDTSGVTLNITRKSLTKSIGYYLIHVDGSIPPHGIEHIEGVCTMSENKTINPFLYAVHTHSLGKVVSGYVIKNNEWFELGKNIPGPLSWFETPYTRTINQGDKIAVRCTMQSDRSYWTYTGSSQEDEMCNFEFMYYVENSDILENNLCVT